MDLILVLKTDAWHSYASEDLIGVCSDRHEVERICKEHAAKNNETIDEDQIWNLACIKQTQGYSGEGEFTTREIEIDTLI